jgi:type VI secretion system protein ImpL
MPMAGKLRLLTAPGLLVYVLLTYLISNVLHLQGFRLWLFRLALWALGLLAFGLIFWFLKRSGDAKEAAEGEGGDEELETTLAAAKARLAGSPATAKASLNKLPIVLVLGPESSAKTSSLVHSGLEPDLLAGAVYAGNQVAPTSSVNLWYTHRTVFLEAGGEFTADPSRWRRLIRYVKPQTLGTVFSGRPQAPRVAVVCFSCEEFLKPDGATKVPAAAKELRTVLVELAHGFGTQLPVYVMFTKADRIPYFAEYVANLSRQEAQEVLGATLRWPTRMMAGSSAEKEFQRVDDAFGRLFTSLAAKRLQFLSRETDTQRKAASYELPREFRKITPLATQFLVDLCRPSQLRISPVLRGFYFSGVRAVVVTEATPEVAPQASPSDSGRIAATQVFDPKQQQPAMEQAAAAASSRKIPQWLFLGRFFRDVLLRDRMAMGVTRTGAHLTLRRRIVMGGAVAFSMLLGSCFTISYFGNRSLEVRAITAADQLIRATQINPNLLDLTTLHAFEDLRGELETVGRWQREGAPWHRRWGLYKGAALYPSVRGLYLERFESLMAGPARSSLEQSLLALPLTPGPNSEYQPNYDLLRSYLMTVGACPIDSAFLAESLWREWLADSPADVERDELARPQFDFYAGRLCLDDDRPCTAAANGGAVRHGRDFLNQFAGPDRNYLRMLSKANSLYPAVRFRDDDGVIVNRYSVPGAFTTEGWATVHEELANIGELLNRDDCVTGAAGPGGQDLAELEASLRERYVADYISRWGNFLDSARVMGFGSSGAATRSLEALSGAESPLLRVLQVASRNTMVDPERVAPAFQPVQAVIPPDSTDQLIGPANQAYMDALLELRGSVEAVSQAQTGQREGEAGDALGAASKARNTVLQLARTFVYAEPHADEAEAVGQAVQRLLTRPIEGVTNLVAGTAAADLNRLARDLCRNRLQPVLNKYPFYRNARTSATLGEVESIFHPETGAIQRFHNDWLQDYLVQEGPMYVTARGARFRLRQDFVAFFNAAARVSEALWPDNTDEPGFQFSLKAQPSGEVTSVRFTIDGRPYNFRQYETGQQLPRWAGAGAQSAEISVELRGRRQELLSFDGTWALFQLFGQAAWLRSSGPRHNIRWTLTPLDEEVTLDAEIIFSGEPVLKNDYFGGVRRCVEQIVN